MEIKNLRPLGEELYKIRLEISKAVEISERKDFEERTAKINKDDDSWQKLIDLRESTRYPLVVYNPKRLSIF